VIERTSLEADISRIAAIVSQRRADRIVLGLPLNMDGTVGPQAKRVRRFAARLKRALGIEIILWDERLTTVEAETVGQERAPAPREREKRRRRTDAIAAAVILQDYLEAQRRSAGQ
jgi:putative Holliday junction resolvase